MFFSSLLISKIVMPKIQYRFKGKWLDTMKNGILNEMIHHIALGELFMIHDSQANPHECFLVWISPFCFLFPGTSFSGNRNAKIHFRKPSFRLAEYIYRKLETIFQTKHEKNGPILSETAPMDPMRNLKLSHTNKITSNLIDEPTNIRAQTLCSYFLSQKWFWAMYRYKYTSSLCVRNN